jgi:hypothetical protein
MDISRKTAAEDAEVRFEAVQDIRWPTFEWFLRQGVPSPALVYPEMPRRARVILYDDRPVFDFADDVGDDDAGVDAMIFLARDDLGGPCDLVAWTFGRRKLASWYSAAALLGAEDIRVPRLTPEGALPVHRTPLGWLKAEREGVVIIEERRGALELRDFGPLAAEDEAHGLELQMLFRNREPQIYVPERRAA